MASVPFAALVALVKSDPRYYSEWNGAIPAEVSFRVVFDASEVDVSSEVFATIDGRQIVLDIDPSAKVRRIEVS